VGGKWQEARSTVLAGAVFAVLVILAVVIVLRITAPGARPGAITIYADDSLRPVVEDIIGAFQRRSDVTVTAYFGSNAEILEVFQDDAAGADLLLTSDAHYIELAADDIVESAALAWTPPVILVRSGNPEGIETLSDLTRTGITVGIADADASTLGRMTPAILAHHGVTMEALGPNVALTSRMDAELGNAVRLGRIDAAIVWEPMAHFAGRSDFIPIPPDDAIVSTVTVGLSAHAASPDSAREFMAFLGGRGAIAFFEHYHYAGGDRELALEPPVEDDELTEVVFGN